MAVDEVMVYGAMALVPILTGIASFFLLRAVYRNAMSVLLCCVLFGAALISGMCLSFGVVLGFASLLHGDGALAIIAAPVTGAILTAPIALLFAGALTLIRSRQPAKH